MLTQSQLGKSQEKKDLIAIDMLVKVQCSK